MEFFMLKWGVLGCSRIAAKVIPLIQNHSEQKILAAASRSSERAKAYAQKFNIERHFFLKLVGTRGVIVMESPFKGGSKETLKAVFDSKRVEMEILDDTDPYEREFRNFYDAVNGTAKPAVSLQETCLSAKTMSALVNSAKAGSLQRVI
jgi:predicted dehydrogenase